jgi:hypothetical protein
MNLIFFNLTKNGLIVGDKILTQSHTFTIRYNCV